MDVAKVRATVTKPVSVIGNGYVKALKDDTRSLLLTKRASLPLPFDELFSYIL